MAEVTGAWGEKIQVPDADTTPQTAAPVEQVIEQPQTAEVPVTDPPNTDAPVVGDTPQPTVIEKIVEVVKEVPAQHVFANDAAKALYEKLTSGDEDSLANYLEEKRRNYDTMSDIDTVKWQLKKENPEWQEKDINAEIRFKYGKSLEKVEVPDREEDPDGYDHAVKHNDAVDDKMLLLERDSRDARIFLNKQKQNIELPKIQQETQVAQAAQPTAEEVAENKRQWAEQVDADMANLTDLKYDIDGEEVAYVLTPTEKSALTAEMKDYEAAQKFTELGWRTAEGRLNPAKMAKDMHILRNLDKIVKSAYEQGTRKGTKEVISKDIKNINLNPQSLATSAPPVDIWQRSGNRYKSN